MAEPKAHISPARYLALERQATTWSEFLDGEIFAMAGPSRRHNLICLNIAAELRGQLRERPREVYSSDLRVHIRVAGLYTCPDVIAVCDRPELEDAALDTPLNPTLLVEVLSKSTAG